MVLAVAVGAIPADRRAPRWWRFLPHIPRIGIITARVNPDASFAGSGALSLLFKRAEMPRPMDVPTINRDSKEYEALIALYESDPPAMIMSIRGQLLIEEVINILLRDLLTGVAQFDPTKMAYATKVGLLGSMGVILPDCVASLLLLNELRNDFSHNAYFELSRRRVRKIAASIPQDLHEIVFRDAQGREPWHILREIVYVCFLSVAKSLTAQRDQRSYAQVLHDHIEDLRKKYGLPEVLPKDATEIAFEQQVAAQRAARFSRGNH